MDKYHEYILMWIQNILFFLHVDMLIGMFFIDILFLFYVFLYFRSLLLPINDDLLFF
jgi:hypothetical protein